MRVPLIKALESMGVLNPIGLANAGRLLVNGWKYADRLDANTYVFLSDTIHVDGAPILLSKKFAIPFN